MITSTSINTNFLTLARMIRLVQNTKSVAVKEWAISQGKQALLAETILNPIK